MLLTLLVITACTWFLVAILLAISVSKRDDKPKDEFNSLSYTDSEYYIIEILTANKGKRLTIQEIGCSENHRTELRIKLASLKAHKITNKKHLPIYDILCSIDESGTIRYGIRK